MRSLLFVSLVVLLMLPVCLADDEQKKHPPVVAPKYDGKPVAAPKGAVVLFDGKKLTGWQQEPRDEGRDRRRGRRASSSSEVGVHGWVPSVTGQEVGSRPTDAEPRVSRHRNS